MPNPRYLLLPLLAVAALPAAARAETPVAIRIAPGRLDASITRLGQQAGISIGLSDRQLAAQRVRGVRGRMTVDEALRRLLDQTDARAIRLGSGQWRIVRTIRSAGSSGTPLRLAVAMPARPTPAPPPQEIVVTAERDQGDLDPRRLHGSIALDGAFALESRGQGSDALVDRLPGLGSTQLGPGRNRLFLRAIADSSFNGPSQAVVGQYLGTARLNYNAPDPDLRLIDLNTIEVRQGPQGTLYGAGTLGGVIRLLPNQPDSTGWNAAQSVSAGATWHGDPSVDASAMLNMPVIADRLGVRAVVYAGRNGGYIDNPRRSESDVNRVDTIGGRLAARLEPGNGWTIDLMAAAQTIDARDAQYAERSGDRLERNSPVAQPHRNRFRLGQLSIGKAWTAFELLSTTTVTGLKLDESYDTSQPGDAPSLFRQRSETRLIANETKLSGLTDGGLAWLVGSSLLVNRYRIRRERGELSMARALAGIENRTEEATAFADLSIPATDRLQIALGGRLTHVHLSGEALDTPLPLFTAGLRMPGGRDQTAFLPSLGLRYRFSANLSGHARYQEGFRPGGIDVRDDRLRNFLPDNVAALETGLAFSSGSFSADATFAYTRWRNIQADLIDTDGLPSTQNIGNGRILTLDATLAWQPLPGLSLEASGVWADSRLVFPSTGIVLVRRNQLADLPVAEGTIVSVGNDLPNVARWSGRLGGRWRTDAGRAGDLTIGGTLRYVGTSRLGIGPILGRPQGDVLDTSLSAELAQPGRSFWVRATNLLDSRGNRFALGSPFTLPLSDQITPLRPRTITIGADFSF
jgi:iron complex outermembrane receptor protein